MSINFFFAVPLLVEDIDPARRDTIHAKVSAYLASERAKRDIAPSPEESVTTSYYKSNAQVLLDANLTELEQFVLGAANRFLETLKIGPRRLEIERSWINLFEPGAQEHQHSHDGSLLSCSYYVEAPQNCGCIVLPDPITARRTHREFTKTSGSDLLNRAEIAAEPQPGRLVMFESWTPHYVQCNKSDRVRISIAMNLREAPPQVAVPTKRDDATAVVGANEAAVAPPAARRTSSDAEPFLFNDVFAIRKDFKLKLAPIQNAIPTIMIDDFLANPERAREVIGQTPAANWKYEPGGKNFVDYYDCRLRFPIRFSVDMIAAARHVIGKVYEVNTHLSDSSVDINWFKQIHEKRADFAVPHNDMTQVRRSFTCIVYLNRAEECSGGTAFFRFKKSGSLVLDKTYLQAIREDPTLSETGLDYWPTAAEQSWETVGTVDMAPSRLLIFPSEHYHAAWHPKDSFYEFPRLTLAFWMIA